MEGLGEKGKAVLLAGEEQRQGEAANKVWAFNKVRLCLHTYFLKTVPSVRTLLMDTIIDIGSRGNRFQVTHKIIIILNNIYFINVLNFVEQ